MKAKIPATTEIRKWDVARQLFIRTADDNYILARWSFLNELNVDFYWLALHALEKYLKAFNLLNGLPAKHAGHNITSLLSIARQKLGSELVPDTLEKPDNIRDEAWIDGNLTDFIDRLNRVGSAHNRYQIYGYQRFPDDLLKLDQAVFRIRRVCKPLDMYPFLGKPDKETENYTVEQHLRDFPTIWQLANRYPLEKAFDGKRGDQVRDALLRMNYAFAPEEYEHRLSKAIFSAENPVLLRAVPSLRRIVEFGELGEEQPTDEDMDIAGWIRDNVHLPADLGALFDQLISSKKK